MRVFFLSLWVLFFYHTGLAKETSLHLEIVNPQGDRVVLYYLGKSDTVALKNKTADISMDLSSAAYFILEHGKQKLEFYLLPGDNLSVTANTQGFLDASFKGGSAPYCNLLVSRHRADKSVQLSLPSFRYPSIQANKFYSMRDSIRVAREKSLREFQGANPGSEAFCSMEKALYEYQMAHELISFVNVNLKSGTTSFPTIVFDYCHSRDLNDERVSFCPHFRQFAVSYLAFIASNAFYGLENNSFLNYHELELDSICVRVTSDKNKSIILAEIAPQVIKDMGSSDMRPYIARLEKCCNDPKLIASFRKASARYEHLYPGKKAPDADFYDVNGNLSSISSYKGKVIYIDTWATWCGPCKREIPHLHELEESMKNENVVFLSVSTDKDINAWKNFLQTQHMSGNQLHQSDDPETSMSKMYNVDSIPRFILIDEEGKIVSANAPRPSSGEQIREIIRSVARD
jgi:thiol-disulfide isomerase/thioredoxin